MFNSQQNKPQNHINTLLDSETRIDGNIQFSGGLRVDGIVNGNIIALPGKTSTLVLSEHAQVHGEICVTHLVVGGLVTGPVRASEYLELQPKARIIGDVHYRAIEIHMGGTVSGRLINLEAEAGAENVVAFKHGNAD